MMTSSPLSFMPFQWVMLFDSLFLAKKWADVKKMPNRNEGQDYISPPHEYVSYANRDENLTIILLFFISCICNSRAPTYFCFSRDCKEQLKMQKQKQSVRDVVFVL